MKPEDFNSLEGRIIYLEELCKQLDEPTDDSGLAFNLVINGAKTDLKMLYFYIHKFGKISLSEVIDFYNKKQK